MLHRPFVPSDIAALSRNSERDVSVRSGKGFSFPQRGWVYVAAEAFYQSERREQALWTAFEAAVTGQHMTDWKASRSADLKPMLQRFLAADRRSSARFVESAFRSPSRVIPWREHDLCLPLGLVLDDDAGRGMRLLWIEKSLRRRKASANLLASATLAAFETARGEVSWLETWFLGTGEVGRYGASDLRAIWSRLDRLLAAAEERANESPPSND